MSRPFGPGVAVQERLEALIASVGAEEATFQDGMGAAALARTLGDALGAKRVEKGVAEMAWRLQKHHGEGSALGAALWGELKALLLDRYRRLDAALRRCHGAKVQLAPSVEELARMLRAA